MSVEPKYEWYSIRKLMLMPGTVINERYVIARFLAKGGGGYVYEAEDRRHPRRVALKQLVIGGDFFQRAFVREAKRLAALHHPAFPEVYDWFEVKKNSFLVMEYISGDDLRQALRNRNAPFALDQVLEWSFILLDALDYLHNFDPVAPVIHRDIKPANLKLNQTNPIRRSAIILIDFGLSKGAGWGISSTSADESIVGGTPYYASPEQEFKIPSLGGPLSASLRPALYERFLNHPTDARSDLYSLAATIYTLLTNIVPNDAIERLCLIKKGENDPLKLIEDVNEQVPHAVAGVIERAMNVEPNQRFTSAAEMSDALRATSNAIAKTDDDSRAHPEADSISTIILSDAAKRAINNTIVLPNRSEPLSTLPASNQEIRYGTLGKCDAAVRSVSFSPRGDLLASGGNDGALRIWNTSTGEVTVLGHSLPGQTGFAYISSVSFAPDGSTIASASNDGAIRLWRTAPVAAEKPRVLAVCRNPPRSIAFAPSGKHLVSGGSDGSVQLWDVGNGGCTMLGLCQGAVWSVAICLDGTFAAAESDDGTVRIWQLDESHAPKALQAFDVDIRSVTISSDGKLIAAAGGDGLIRIADAGASHMRELATCDSTIRSIAFSSNGEMIALGGEDKFVRICDVQTGALRTLGQCDDFISSVAFRSDNRTVASGSWDKSVRQWDVMSHM